MTSSAMTILGADDTLRERLMDKMKAAFIEAIPQEKLDAMMTSAFDEFLHGPRAYRFAMRKEYLSAGDERNPTGKDGYVTFEEELAKPMKPVSNGYQGNTNSEPYIVTQDTNTLPGMIYAMVHEHAKTFARKMFEGPEYLGNHDYQTNQVTYVEGVVKQYLQENTGKFVEFLLAGVVRQSMQAAMYQMTQNGNGAPIYR